MYNNLAEAHCYGIGRTGQIVELSRSSEKTDRNVRCFDHEGLRQLQCCIGEDAAETEEDVDNTHMWCVV